MCAEQYDKSETDSDEEGEQIQQMFSEESDNDECFESILLILVHLIHDSRGVIGPKIYASIYGKYKPVYHHSCVI